MGARTRVRVRVRVDLGQEDRERDRAAVGHVPRRHEEDGAEAGGHDVHGQHEVDHPVEHLGWGWGWGWGWG